MRIQQSTVPSEKQINMRIQPGQIMRGKILQLFPFDRARIQLGELQVIAQLEAPLEHGKPYYFQVLDVEKEIHLRVIQDPFAAGKNELQQLLKYLGSRPTSVREQFVRQLLQAGIPFTKSSLQHVFTLLDNHPNPSLATNVLQQIMQRQLPVTNEIMESLIVYQSSSFTKEMTQLYQTLQQLDSTNPTTRLLMQQIEQLMPDRAKKHRNLVQLHQHITTKTNIQELQFLQWLHPQIKKNKVAQLSEMPVEKRQQFVQTPEKLFKFLGVPDVRNQQLFSQTIAAVAINSNVLQKEINQFLQKWEANTHFMALQSPNMRLDAYTREHLEQVLTRIATHVGLSEEQLTRIRQHAPATIRDLLQLMIDVKRIPIDTLQQLGDSVENKDGQLGMSKGSPVDVMRAVQRLMHHIGLSYERSIAHGQMEGLTETLKGSVLQFLQEQGTNSARAQPLMKFIQGMQLQTVQETPHMLGVHIQLPAMFEGMRSDLHMEFESKKTPTNTIDPDYCRILFDLDLAALKRTLIDMHIQYKQITFTIFNDHPWIKKAAAPFETLLKENLQQTGYDVTVIRYESLHHTKKMRKQQKIKPFEHMEGFDMKI